MSPKSVSPSSYGDGSIYIQVVAKSNALRSLLAFWAAMQQPSEIGLFTQLVLKFHQSERFTLTTLQDVPRQCRHWAFSHGGMKHLTSLCATKRALP